MEDFRHLWHWSVQNGLIQGDPEYYATGKASADEYRNALNVLMGHVMAARQPGSGYNPQFTVQLMTKLFHAGGLVNPDEVDYWAHKSGADEIGGFLDAVVPRAMGGSDAGRTAAAPPSAAAPQVPAPGPHPAEPGAPAAPVVGTSTGVLAGGDLVRIRQPDNTYRWYQVYQLPPGSGKYVAYQFNNIQQVDAAYGGTPGFHDWTQQNLDIQVNGAIGAAEEVIGMAGNWNTFATEIMRDTAAAAGVNDPTLIGKMWSDPSMQDIAAKALIGDWTPEQIKAEQRKTTFWTDVLYPGIKAFYGRTTEPERAWADYTGNVSPALTALGYAKDADGTYNTQIKKMLDSGLDDQIFLENVPIFQQATQNQAFFNVYQQRAAQRGITASFGDWFNIIKGQAAPELMEIAEEATVAYQGQQANINLGENMLGRLVAERDLSEAEARNIFSEVNQAVLALGETGLARGGLNRDDILSAAAGIAPTSGMSGDEVKQRVAKIVQEADLFDEQKVNFYLGFDASGRPMRPGLQPLRGEAA